MPEYVLCLMIEEIFHSGWRLQKGRNVDPSAATEELVLSQSCMHAC